MMMTRTLAMTPMTTTARKQWSMSKRVGMFMKQYLNIMKKQKIKTTETPSRYPTRTIQAKNCVVADIFNYFCIVFYIILSLVFRVNCCIYLINKKGKQIHRRYNKDAPVPSRFLAINPLFVKWQHSITVRCTFFT